MKSYLVDDLINSFKLALDSLIVPLKSVGLMDESLTGYDELDEIFEILFSNIVVGTLKWSVPKETRATVRILPYGFQVDGYSDLSFIGVRSRDKVHSKNQQYIFIEFVVLNLGDGAYGVAPIRWTG